MIKSAEFSHNKIYRYTLTRIWDEDKPYVAFIGLNPSTADETKDDPTIRRCINYAKGWGYGGLIMLNLFGYRSTDPNYMKQCPLPIGPANTDWIVRVCLNAGIVIAAWGIHGSHLSRDKAILNHPALKDKIHYLALTKDNQPRHPLYLKKDLKPIKWSYENEENKSTKIKRVVCSKSS